MISLATYFNHPWELGEGFDIVPNKQEIARCGARGVIKDMIIDGRFHNILAGSCVFIIINELRILTLKVVFI